MSAQVGDTVQVTWKGIEKTGTVENVGPTAITVRIPIANRPTGQGLVRIPLADVIEVTR